MTSNSRFAKADEIFSEKFASVNDRLAALHKKHGLQDHKQINESRFTWHNKITYEPMYYAARMWEFPFAIIESDLVKGMKVADVGCGNTPFTALLAELVGAQNVTGFDPDYIIDDSIEGHSHFGARKSFINSLGINFHNDGMTKLTAKDESFDVVFCISVLEHIDDISVKQQGVKEMARIVKPGGKLILTFDLGINMPLNDIFQIIQYSGLTPAGTIDFHWPKERFVNYGNGSTVDVFGLVLEKPAYLIYKDGNKNKEIPAYTASAPYIRLAEHYAISYNQALAARDLKSSKIGPLKVFIKSILGKYN